MTCAATLLSSTARLARDSNQLDDDTPPMPKDETPIPSATTTAGRSSRSPSVAATAILTLIALGVIGSVLAPMVPDGLD